MLTSRRQDYLNFLTLLQDSNNEIILVNKVDTSDFPRGTKFKIDKVIFNSHIIIKPIDFDTEILSIHVPFREELMDEPRSPMNYLYEIQIHKKDFDIKDSSRLYPSYRDNEEPKTIELTEVQEEFLREYTYILKAKKDIGSEFIKGKEYHVVNELHSKNEHLVYVFNESNNRILIPCGREDFCNPNSFINNFELYKRKGSHQVNINDSETTLEKSYLERCEKEDFLYDITEHPSDYRIICKKNVKNESYREEEGDSEYDFICGNIYFGDLSELEDGYLELLDEHTKVNGNKHTVITDIEEFFDENSWFNTHFFIEEK